MKSKPQANAEHHIIPTGYGNASNKSNPVGMRDYQKGGAGRRGSAWHQLIGSLFSRCCEPGKFILKQNAAATSI